MALIRVVLDACVMLPQNLNNVLLTFAEDGLFVPVWTDTLLDEVQTNLVKKFDVAATQAEHRISQMRQAFPFAADEAAGYQRLIPAMTNHRKDRHVLAAAVASRAALIVTADFRGFPADALEPFGVEAVHPDEFLLDQLDLDRGRVLASLDRLVARNRQAPLTVPQLAGALTSFVPQFAVAVRSAVGAPVLPVVAVSNDEILATNFSTGKPTPYTPLGTAMKWGIALANQSDFAVELTRLTSVNSGLNNQFDDVAALLDGYALATLVHDHERWTDVAYVQFVRSLGYSAEFFDHGEISDYRVLELHRGADGWWRAHALYLDTWPPEANPTGHPDTKPESAT
jgi:predicted nucleic acid-binding protein